MHKRHPDRRLGFLVEPVLTRATDINVVETTRYSIRRLEWIMQRLSTTRSNNFTRWATMRLIRGSCKCKPPPRPGTLYGNFWIPLRSLITIVLCGFVSFKAKFIFPYYLFFPIYFSLLYLLSFMR